MVLALPGTSLGRRRGRLGEMVKLWTTGASSSRKGLAVSSVVVGNGSAAHVLALVDLDADTLRAADSRRGETR
jgi:hypothetical protein